MAFLAYRFLPGRGCSSRSSFWRPLRAAAAARLARGRRDGRLPDRRLRRSRRSGWSTRARRTPASSPGLFVVLTPLFGAAAVRHPRRAASAWAAAGVSALGLLLLSGAGGDASLRGDGARVRLRVRVRGPHPGHRARRCGATTSARWSRCSSASAASSASSSRRSPGDLEAPRGRDRLERAARHLAGRERARLPRAELCPAHDLVRAHGADPGRRAGIRGAVRLPARRTSGCRRSAGPGPR